MRHSGAGRTRAPAPASRTRPKTERARGLTIPPRHGTHGCAITDMGTTAVGHRPAGWDHEKAQYEVNPMFLGQGAGPEWGTWDEAEMQMIDACDRAGNDEDDEYEGRGVARPERRVTTAMNHASVARWRTQGSHAKARVPLVFRRAGRIEIALVRGARAQMCVNGQTAAKEGNESRIDAERQGRMRREVGRRDRTRGKPGGTDARGERNLHRDEPARRGAGARARVRADRRSGAGAERPGAHVEGRAECARMRWNRGGVPVPDPLGGGFQGTTGMGREGREGRGEVGAEPAPRSVVCAEDGRRTRGA